MLALPAFLRDEAAAAPLAGFVLTGFFLYAPRGLVLPDAHEACIASPTR